MRVKGLAWRGIPADDYPSAIRFFTQTLGMDEAGTMGLSAENDDAAQVSTSKGPYSAAASPPGKAR
jgi:hypothetical protein